MQCSHCDRFEKSTQALDKASGTIYNEYTWKELLKAVFMRLSGQSFSQGNREKEWHTGGFPSVEPTTVKLPVCCETSPFRHERKNRDRSPVRQKFLLEKGRAKAHQPRRNGNMMHQLKRRLVCAVCALAMLAALLPTAAFAAEPDGTSSDIVQQSLTASDVREMQQADDAVTALTDSTAFEQMSETERSEAAREQLDELVQQGLVKKGSIYTDEENGMVSFTYSCGALGGILLTDLEEENNNTIAFPSEQMEQLTDAAENKRVGSAVIYYAFDNTVNSTRYPYYAYMQSYWNSVGLQTDLNTTVTLSDLRRMGGYDLVVLSTHGAYYTYEYGWPWKKTTTEPLILLTEKSDFWSDLRYGFDLLSHKVIKINGMYAATGAFFRSAYRGSGIVLSETCEFYGKNGHVDTSIRDALLAGGAKAVAGYVNNVYSVYSRSMLWAMVNRMIEGETLEEAAEYAQEIYGTDDIIWYNSQGGRRPHAAAAYLILGGDRTVTLPNPYTEADGELAA